VDRKHNITRDNFQEFVPKLLKVYTLENMYHSVRSFLAQGRSFADDGV